MHFFNILTSKSGPTLRCFVPFYFEIGFAPQRRTTFHLSSPQMSPYPPVPQNHEKKQCFATFTPFRAPAFSFFDLSSDSSPCWLLFNLSILSDVWLLNFLRWYYNIRICRSFTTIGIITRIMLWVRNNYYNYFKKFNFYFDFDFPCGLCIRRKCRN